MAPDQNLKQLMAALPDAALVLEGDSVVLLTDLASVLLGLDQPETSLPLERVFPLGAERGRLVGGADGLPLELTCRG